MKSDARHWTSEDPRKFQFAVAFDFVAELQRHMEETGLPQNVLAERAGLSESRISQVINNPGNLTLLSIVKLAKAAGLKISVVSYDDGDEQHARGPIGSPVFRECWVRCGSPKTSWDLDEEGTTFPVLPFRPSWQAVHVRPAPLAGCDPPSEPPAAAAGPEPAAARFATVLGAEVRSRVITLYPPNVQERGPTENHWLRATNT